MRIIIFHGFGHQIAAYKRNAFDNLEDAESHFADMLSHGFHACGAMVGCKDGDWIIAGIRPEGTLMLLPLELCDSAPLRENEAAFASLKAFKSSLKTHSEATS